MGHGGPDDAAVGTRRPSALAVTDRLMNPSQTLSYMSLPAGIASLPLTALVDHSARLA